MNKIFRFFVIFLILMTAGCINCYLRCPVTDQKIDEVYKSTKAGVGMSFVVMFPQIMSTAGSNGFEPMNIISVPIGCLCFVDVACEAVLDTVFFPTDWWLTKARK